MNKLLLLLFLFNFGSLLAQPMKVQRCADIDRRVPIINIHVDEDKNKWVADKEGIFLAQSPDYASTVDFDASEWSLLSVPDGNQELTLPKANLQKIMGDDFSLIKTAHLDKRKNELWIGTEDAGLFHFKISPSLQLLKKITTSNSKLRSNNIQTILATPQGKILVGTDDGLFIKNGSKSDLYGKFFDVSSIAYQNGTIWMVGDGEVLEVQGKNDIYALAVKSGMTEGDVVDIAFDSKGRLWIASQVVIRYSFDTQRFEEFGPADGFTSQAVKCIAVDSDDALWAGTQYKGVFFIGKASTMNATVIIDAALGCNADAKNAALVVRATGGEPPYIYKWNKNIDGEKPKHLGPGEYIVTVTDQNGTSTTSKATIADPRLTIQIAQDKEASSGGGENAKASIIVNGGKAPYQYQWDNGETTKIATKLNEGEHTVTISDSKGCKTTSNITITEALAQLSVALLQTNPISCKGQKDANIKATVKGGKAPYTYKWSITDANTDTAVDLATGTYKVTTTDAVGNTARAEILIEEPTELTAAVSLVANATTNQADGKASVQVQGGNQAYNYKWDTNETTENSNKLNAGSHTVTVIDAAGCSTTATIEIGEDILPLAVELEQTAKINCAGESVAALSAKITGGKSPFQYQWNTENTNNEIASNLSAGDYQLTITDAAGNTSNTAITIKEPTALIAEISAIAPASTNNADGQATVKVEGGSGNFSYKWDTNETTATAKKLDASKHTVTVFDEAGCSTTASIEIGEDILPLNIEIVETNKISCAGKNDATLSVVVKGGKSPFQYQWNTQNNSNKNIRNLYAGEYQVTVSDATGNTSNTNITIKEPTALSAKISVKAPASTNNADGQATVKVEGGSGNFSYKWDTGETKATAKKLDASKHTVTITDEAGCTTTANIEIGEDILPLAIELIETNKISCAEKKDATLSVELTGGKAPFHYKWNTTNSNNEIANNLSAGDYSVTVTDATGTKAEAKLTIAQPEQLTVSITVNSPASTNNADGQAIALVNGGSGKYTFQWDTGETNATAKKLDASKHTVIVTDESACSTTASFEVTEDIIPLKIKLNQNASISCAGANNAAVSVEVVGGKGPFEYLWSINETKGNKITDLSAGEYHVTITDATGTEEVANINITEPEPLSISLVQDDPATANNANGKASVKAKGGSGKYAYRWSNGETTATAIKLALGIQEVTVTDSKACSSSDKIKIDENILPLSISLNQTAEINCAGEPTAVLDVIVKGGKSPYQYLWNSEQLDGPKAVQLSAGKYMLTITDASGLSKRSNIEITEPKVLSAKIINNTPTTNDVAANGKASVKVKGGTPNYSYKWDMGASTASVDNLTMGAHSVTITDAQGCSTSLSFETAKKILPKLDAKRLSTGQTLQVSRLYFKADSTMMTPESFPTLNEIANFLKRNQGVVIEIGGHTNNIPDHDFCDQLSLNRAQSVASYITQKGIDPGRIVAKGYGKRKPKFTNKTQDGREKNQRVEIKILSLE